jgi:hypothetical protein
MIARLAMTRSILRASCLLASLLAFALPLAAQKGIPEPRIGLEVKPPKGWTELPGHVDRGATVRLFAAPRALSGKTEITHTPILRAMFFAAGGDASKDVVDGLPRMTAFRSLEDFAVRGLGVKDAKKSDDKAKKPSDKKAKPAKPKAEPPSNPVTAVHFASFIVQ